MKGRRRWLRLLCLLCLLPLLLVLWLMTRIVVFADNHDDDPADAALVLGAAAWYTRPSPVFEERIRHAITLYRAGRVRMIVFTGGRGRGDTRSEASVAKNYALRQGVPDAAILTESESHSTWGNLSKAKILLDRYALRRVLVVSDPLHMRRAITMARDLGIDAWPAPTPTSRFQSLGAQFELLLRETYNYARYKFGRHFIDFDEIEDGWS
ncbi:YdcF family protein [Plasticicumulans acidivorans]|uniref:Uncharacterized SAM-binding protein YcdF (DUF218 family) n=1 Tax=Plasticicumulans acidivorans TaxID=886464 RepID=A0A317MVG0_9GAMM|nr:YdcF family protein [Plasticicumulans acidivorans]PWV58458.1 uncharacterized SAM-binding protein YcdF (DUF218 family) [Plasticicumulans acidivorans]